MGMTWGVVRVCDRSVTGPAETLDATVQGGRGRETPTGMQTGV
jgi:hypothetical protein